MLDRDYTAATLERTAYIAAQPAPAPAAPAAAPVSWGCDERNFYQTAQELATLRSQASQGGGDGPTFPVAAAATLQPFTRALVDMATDRDFAQAARDLAATRSALMSTAPLDRDYETAAKDLTRLRRRMSTPPGVPDVDRDYETAAKDLARLRAGAAPTFGFDRGFGQASSERAATVASSPVRMEITQPEPLPAADVEYASEDRCFAAAERDLRAAKARPTAPLDRDFNVAQRELAEVRMSTPTMLSTIDRDFPAAAADLAQLRAAVEVYGFDRSFAKAATDYAATRLLPLPEPMSISTSTEAIRTAAAAAVAVAVCDSPADRDFGSAARDLSAMHARAAGHHVCDGANDRSYAVAAPRRSDKQRAVDLQLVARAMADPFGHRRSVTGIGQMMKKPTSRSKRSAGYSSRAHIPMVASHRQLGRNAR